MLSLPDELAVRGYRNFGKRSKISGDFGELNPYLFQKKDGEVFINIWQWETPYKMKAYMQDPHGDHEFRTSFEVETIFSSGEEFSTNLLFYSISLEDLLKRLPFFEKTISQLFELCGGSYAVPD